eukprot:m.191246 g.191246  ORF g.191246 m.191246 type:complete len:588 (-) comp32422_c0_seq5:250-2013(-)
MFLEGVLVVFLAAPIHAIYHQTIDIDFGVSDLDAIPPNTFCSLYGFSNGTQCGCGIALRKKCPTLRGKQGTECTTCVESVEFNHTSCPTSIKEEYCGGCSPKFDFEWIDQVPANTHNITLDNTYDVFYVCEEITNSTNASGPILPFMDLLRIFGCNGYVSFGYLKGLGYNVTVPVQMDDNTTVRSPDQVLHDDSITYILDCCRNFRNKTFFSYCHESDSVGSIEVFWELLNKATNTCQRDLLEKELAATGFQLPDITPGKPFGGMYVVDLRKLSFLLNPIIGVAIRELYGASLRYLVGLTFAAAERHSCGHSWFVPGADKIYADTFQIQGDFYFGASDPSPFESTGTCGLSAFSETTRFDVCDKFGTHLYDNAHISGMSILACTVDCTASRLQGVPGAFVSIIVVVVEVDVNTGGFGKNEGGLAGTIATLNSNGLNITNDVKSTVGVGYRFSSKQLTSEDILKDINWSFRNKTDSSANLTAAMAFPNMTEAMLAYHPHTTPSDNANSQHDTYVIIAAVVPSAVLVGVLIGVFMHKRRATQTRDQRDGHGARGATVANEMVDPIMNTGATQSLASRTPQYEDSATSDA